MIESLATSLGNALQITNILRDVKEDAQANRLYIPEEMLEKASITSTNPTEVIVNKNLAIAREALARIAEEEFKKSEQMIKLLDKKSARSVKAIMAIYKKYFDIMKNRGWEIISPKPQISKFGKFTLAAKAYFLINDL